MSDPELDFMAVWEAEVGERPVGHSHFWERAFSRRQVLSSGARLAGAAAVGSALGLPAIAKAAAPGLGEPRPIPGGTTGLSSSLSPCRSARPSRSPVT